MTNSMYTLLLLLGLLLGNTRATALPGMPQDAVSQGKGIPARQRTFLENKGQIKDQYGNARPDIDVQLRDKGMSLFIGNGKIRYQLERMLPGTTATDHYNQPLSYSLETYRVELTLLGANPKATLEKLSPTAIKNRYYGTGIPEQGYTARGYQKLVYKNVYPQIDWTIYIKEEGIEYDFIVHPGGNVADIRMEYQGAEKLQQNVTGGLTISTPLGTIQESHPVTYQEDGTVISSNFVVEGNTVGFRTAAHNGKITIDPQVKWGTYVGGNYMFDDVISLITDSKGNLYCSGQASSSNIATAGSFKNTIGGIVDAFLSKFDADGKQIWGTYFGGPGLDRGYGLSIDSLDNVYLYVLNLDGAAGLATAGAHQTTAGGGWEIILAKFNETGERVWSTYYGGSRDEGWSGMNTIRVVNGSLYVYASTKSPDNIATPGAEKTTINSTENFFLAKFTLDGRRIWSTYVQGSDSASIHARGMSSDSKGNIYLGGHVFGGKGWSTTGSHQPNVGSNNAYDAVLLKYDSAGKKVWGTYYGGTALEFCNTIVCDKDNNVYMAGTTQSSNDIATAGSMQPTIKSTTRADYFIVKFDETGKRQWGTYLGGTENESNPILNIMNDNSLMLSGNTTSWDIKITDDAIQKLHGGGATITGGDWYLARMDRTGNILWSSYYGGGGDDVAYFSHINGADMYVSGSTNSPASVATPGSHQDTYGTPLMTAGLMAKFCFSEIPVAGYINGPDSICANQLNTYSIADIGDVESCIWTLPEGWSGSSTGLSIDISNNDQSGSIAVQIIRCGDTSVPSLLPVHVLQATEAIITIDEFTLGTVNKHSNYQWMFNDELIEGATQETYTVNENGNYRVITTDANGCTDTSDVYKVTNVSIEGHMVYQPVRIYPNPATDALYIQAAVPVFTTVWGIDGKVMIRDAGTKKLDISKYAAGVYLIQVKDTAGNMLYNRKFVKM